MRRTFPGRRLYITGGGDQPNPPTTTEVLETFPRFLDTEGLVFVAFVIVCCVCYVQNFIEKLV